MTEEDSKINLNTNGNDHVALVTKSLLGIIPCVGSPLAEIVGAIIPNQRIDRVASYLEKLQSMFDDESFKKIKELPDKIAIIEEGMFAVGLTPYRERIERITYVIANSLNKKQISADTECKLLFAAKNISDFDAIVLENCRLWGKELQGHSLAIPFEKMHSEVFPEIKGSFFGNDSEREEYKKSKEIYEIGRERVASSKRHLASLSLLKRYPPRMPLIEEKGLSEAVERLCSSFSEEVYCITDFGLAVLNAMKAPQKESSV